MENFAAKMHKFFCKPRNKLFSIEADTSTRKRLRMWLINNVCKKGPEEWRRKKRNLKIGREKEPSISSALLTSGLAGTKKCRKEERRGTRKKASEGEEGTEEE